MSIQTNIVTATCVACVLMMVCAAEGTPIDPLDTALDLTQANPDIAAVSGVNTAYDAESKSFTVTGYPSKYVDANDKEHAISGLDRLFTLNASIDNSGVLESGTLTITGYILDLVDPLANLITVNLTSFGVHGTGSGTVFEFIGTTTGGALSTAFDSEVGVILNPGSTTYDGFFTSDFTGSTGTVDTFLIPEPASVMLLLGCMSAVASRRRRRGSLR